MIILCHVHGQVLLDVITLHSPLSWVIYLVCYMLDVPSDKQIFMIIVSPCWEIFDRITWPGKKKILASIIDICWFLSAITSQISTYITATCHPAASTIKPTKLFTHKVIRGLLHHELIACLSTGSASCRLKNPERENVYVSPLTQMLHQTLSFSKKVSLRRYADWEVTCCGVSLYSVSSCAILWKSIEVAFRLRLCCFEGVYISLFLCSAVVFSKMFNEDAKLEFVWVIQFKVIAFSFHTRSFKPAQVQTQHSWTWSWLLNPP